jgi:SAM-dependent methyltransferase
MKATKDLSRLYGTRDVMEAIIEMCKGDVLDFGAGTAKLRTRILGGVKSYTAFDMEALPGIDIVGDVLHPDIADASFDTIISNQVMEHVKKPWIMVEQMARMLRPDGLCIATAPFTYPFHADPNDYFRFTEAGMKTLFEDAGLEIVLCTKYGEWWSTIWSTMKQRFFNPYSKKRGWLRRRLSGAAEAFFRALDHTTPPGIVYGNVICIGRKPSNI